MPTELIENDSEVISIIGGPASGKSNYIVSLIQQLQKYGHKLHLSQILPQMVGRSKRESTRTLYRAAKDSIFKYHTPVARTATTEHPIPWIFRLESHITKKVVYLVFYDTAGECFRDIFSISRYAKYFAKSSAVIVLLDTLSLGCIKNVLDTKNIVNHDPATPFNETIDALCNFILDNTDFCRKPFAFVMSKFDAVILNKDSLGFDISPFLHDSSFITTGKFSLRQIDEASEFIKHYMMSSQWDEGAVQYYISNNWGDNARFFGVSALGAMTNSNMQIDIPKDEDVKPLRVMDPLIWILYKLGGFGIPTDE